MHISDWKRKHKYSNWGYVYPNEFIVLAEGRDMFRLVFIARQEYEPVRQSDLYKKNFGWRIPL
jgi:hypothetical protein